MKTLDFLVIGAQKCATTTLFELLRQHPRLQLPLEKEVPFFTGEAFGEDCDEDDGEAVWSRFSKRYFGDASDVLWGKITPQYMADSDVPRRIATLMPGTKLIAVLRDPVERSRSHYRMGLRRHTEARSFDAAMRALLTPAAIVAGREGRAPQHRGGYESEAAYYLAWSEYGRILQNYREYFPSGQLLVLYSEDLQADPEGVLAAVLRFLGLAPDFRPRGLGDVMHAGGSGERIPHGMRVWLRERSLIARLWRRVPAQQQGRLRFLYERWNSTSTRDPLPLDASTEQALRAHFAADAQTLCALGVATPPWIDSYAMPGAERSGTHAADLCASLA